MKGSTSFSEAVAVTNGKISYVGNDQGARAMIGDDTDVKDLDGRMMMPGIIDDHWHGRGSPPVTWDTRAGPSTRSLPS